jgi:hypothetical protein
MLPIIRGRGNKGMTSETVLDIDVYAGFKKTQESAYFYLLDHMTHSHHNEPIIDKRLHPSRK